MRPNDKDKPDKPRPAPDIPEVDPRRRASAVRLGLACLLVAPLVASCGFAPLEAKIAASQEAAAALVTEPRPAPPPARALVVVHDGPYLPSRRIPHTTARWLHEPVTLRVAAMPFDRCLQRALEQLRNQPSVVFAPDLDAGADDPDATPLRGAPVTLDHRGTFREFLDLLADASGFGWEQKAGALHWMAEVARTFEVHRVPGDFAYTMQTSGASGQVVQAGSGGGASGGVRAGPAAGGELNVTLGDDFWENIGRVLSDLLGPEHPPIIDRTTATVHVRGPAGLVRAAGRHIDAVNAWLARQVLLDVQVVTVSLADSNAFGIDWQIVNRAIEIGAGQTGDEQAQPTTITGATGTSGLGGASATALGLGLTAPTFGARIGEDDDYGTSSLILHALAAQGETSVRNAPRLVTLNGQAAQIQVLNDRAILGEVEVTTRDTATATTQERLTPSTVSTGVALTILPKIVGTRVFLQASIQVSDLVAIESAGRAGGQSIQLPTVTRNQFFQSARLESGETLALGGMSVERGTAQDRSFGRLSWLGGKNRQSRRSEMVLLITPTLLDPPAPDEPAL